MPNPDVLDKIIQCYLEVRAKGRQNVTLSDSIATRTSNFFQSMAWQTDDKSILKLCDDVKKQFRPKERDRLERNDRLSLSEWIETVYYLGEKSKEAQNNKVSMFGLLHPNESLLCNTLHALRNYIVLSLRKEYPDEFAAEIKQYQNDMGTSHSRASRSAYKNLDVTMHVDTENRKLLYLAYLEEVDAIYNANQRGLFKPLIPLNDDKRNSPRCLQEDFCKVLYEEVYQKHTKISFDEFVHKGLTQSKFKGKFSPNPGIQNEGNEDDHSESEMRPGH